MGKIIIKIKIMISEKEFYKIFNKNFWKNFNKKLFPIYEKLNDENKKNILKELYNDIKIKNYYPSTPKTNIFQNKGLGVARVIPVFEIKDYCLYYYCIKILEKNIAIDRVENTYGGWSLGGIIRRKETEEINRNKENHDNFEKEYYSFLGLESHTEYSFNPLAWAKAYGDFNSKLYISLLDKEEDNVLELDISNFFDNIKLDILERKIREISDKNISDEISILFHFLQYWDRNINHYNKKTVGIPQDALADCSRLLSNFYLQDYDKYLFDICKKRGFTYLRYCDDQFIIGNDKSILEEILFLASKKLNTIGLNINQKKVKINTVKEVLEYRSFKLFDLVTGENTSNINNIELFIDYYFKLRDSGNYFHLKSKGISLLNKAINLNLDNISIDKKTKLIGYFLEEDFLLKANSYKFYKIYNLLSEENRLEFLKKLNALSNSTLHNQFHYELIRFLKEIKQDFIHIIKRIKIIDSL